MPAVPLRGQCCLVGWSALALSVTLLSPGVVLVLVVSAGAPARTLPAPGKVRGGGQAVPL